MPLVKTHLPDLHPWVSSMYGAPTSLYFGDFSHPDLPPTTILSKTGTRQGCPLGAQLFALGLHPLLCSLARLMGREGSVISYSDDLHLVGPPATVSLALKALLQLSPPLEASVSLDCRLSALGLSLSPGKSSILLGNEVTPATIEFNFGPQLLSSLGASISLISSTGHVVLGSPIGSSHYVTTFAERAIDEARRILGLVSSLLLDRDSTGAPDAGIFSPDEHNCLIRYTVRSKVSHLLRTLPPNTASQHFSRLHTDLLNNHLNICPQSVPHETALTFKLSSPHLDVRKLASLPLALGGHGFLPFSHERPLPHSDSPTNRNQTDPTLTYHHASFYASWACTWSRIRAWVPPLRDESFPPVTNVTPYSPPLPPFQAQVIDTWLAINLASARLQSHPHRARLPSHYSIPINPRSRKSGPGLFLECRSALDSGRDFFGDVET